MQDAEAHRTIELSLPTGAAWQRADTLLSRRRAACPPRLAGLLNHVVDLLAPRSGEDGLDLSELPRCAKLTDVRVASGTSSRRPAQRKPRRPATLQIGP